MNGICSEGFNATPAGFGCLGFFSFGSLAEILIKDWLDEIELFYLDLKFSMKAEKKKI